MNAMYLKDYLSALTRSVLSITGRDVRPRKGVLWVLATGARSKKGEHAGGICFNITDTADVVNKSPRDFFRLEMSSSGPVVHANSIPSRFAIKAMEKTGVPFMFAEASTGYTNAEDFERIQGVEILRIMFPNHEIIHIGGTEKNSRDVALINRETGECDWLAELKGNQGRCCCSTLYGELEGTVEATKKDSAYRARMTALIIKAGFSPNTL